MRAAIALVFLTLPAAGDVLDVGGPNPDFFEISPAVLAASEGDVVRVWPGNYGAFTVAKPLAIVRADPDGAVRVKGTIRVRDLAADEAVELTGVEAEGLDGSALVVQNCAGAVRVREGVFRGAAATGFESFPGVRVLASDDVELVFCSAFGGEAAFGEYGSPGGDGLVAQDARLSLFASVFTGTDGTTDDDPGASGYGGGTGVVAHGPGVLYVSGCTLAGGDGGPADHDVDWWTGEYGYGGGGGWGQYGSTPTWFLDCTLDPGAGGWSPDPNHVGHDGQASSGGIDLPGRARILRTSGLAHDAQGLAVRCEGAPGDDVWLLEGHGPAYRFHPVRGPFLVEDGPGAARLPWLHLGTLDASGVLVVEIPARDLALLGHETRHFQATFLKGKDYFGSSSWSVVLDTGW